MSERRISYARGYIDEGNWFEALIETSSGAQGNLSFPLSCLPETLQERAKQFEPVWVRITVEADNAHVVAPDSKPHHGARVKQR